MLDTQRIYRDAYAAVTPAPSAERAAAAEFDREI